MPIHVNLLAEAQAAEEMRRRDPVKLAVYVGALLVVLFLVWSSSLQVKSVIAKKDLSRLQTQIALQTNKFNEVLLSNKSIEEAQSKLQALQKLSASRFLQGILLNALQKVAVDNVQLVRVRLSQSFVPSDKNILEKTVLILDARDFSANPGDQMNKFKEAIANQPYFKSALSITNSVQLAAISQVQTDGSGKPYEQFTLNCNFPDQIR